MRRSHVLPQARPHQFDGSPVSRCGRVQRRASRARLWRGTASVEGAIFVETISFGETRDYVKKVMANTVYYAASRNRAPPLRRAWAWSFLAGHEDVKSTQNGSVLE